MSPDERRARRRVRILAGLGLGLAACASGAGASLPTRGDAGCVTVTVSPKPAMAPVTLKATAVVQFGGGSIYEWTVTRDDQPVPDVRILDGGESVSVDAQQPGKYLFEVTVNGAGASCSASDQVQVTGAGVSVPYSLRITPPVASALPRQDRVVVLTPGGMPEVQQFTLEAGLPIQAKLLGPGGVPTAGTVRFLGDAGIDLLAAAGPDGALDGLLLATQRYQVVVIPSSDLLAPSIAAESTPGAMIVAGPFSVDRGIGVTGQISDEAGKPVAGARVVLESGPLPSTVGRTDAGGAFALRAVAGSYAVLVQADGRPEVHGPVASFADGARVQVSYLPGFASVGGQVLGSDGSTPSAGARVTVSSVAAAVKVATVVVSGGPPASADGIVHLSAVTTIDGRLPALRLPAGDYDVLIEPVVPLSDGATRSRQRVGPGLGDLTWALALAPRTRLAGAVTDGGTPIPSVRVTAVEQGGLGVSRVALTGMDGRYQLPPLDAGAGLDVYFDPPLSSDANRHFQRGHLVLPPGTARADFMLQKGLEVSGVLYSPTGAPLGGALIEARPAGVVGAEPVGVGSSDAQGTFRLYLPKVN